MKKWFLFLVSVVVGLLINTHLLSQAISESFESTTVPATGWTYNSVTHGTNNPRTGTRCATFNGNNDAIITPLCSNPGVITFYYRRSGTSPTSPKFIVSYGTSTSGPWTTIGSEISTFTTTYNSFTYDLTGESNIYIRVLHTRSAGTNEIYLDDFNVTHVTSTPTIAVSPTTLTGFNYTEDVGPSAEQNFVISGSNLTANISITPPTNYEISTGTGGSFVPTNPITLSQSGGTVSNTTIYVRLKSGLTAGSYNSEDITATSTGATNKTVTCSGTVVDYPNWCNIQSPGTGSIATGGAFNVYARIYEPGLTTLSGSQAAITCWIGYSTSNTNPNTWTNWVAATFNAEYGNDDEYVANIGPSCIPAGTYYYASRFSVNGGSTYSYGGFSAGGGGFYDGSTYVNGTLTVSANYPDWVNLQWPASGSISVGGTYNVYAQVFEAGVTEAGGAGANVSGWIGYSTSNTNPNTWTNWVAATFNSQSVNNDEFVAEIGSALPAGTYYYASRFKVNPNANEYSYGGYNGGAWDGATNVSGVLTVTTPTITVSPTTLTGFTYVEGSGPSTEQTFTISGANLTGNISIAAPTNYEISLSSGAGYTSPLTLTPSSGTVSNTTVYVRLKSGLSTGDYNSENITASSSGATNKTVACSGNVSSPYPPVDIVYQGFESLPTDTWSYTTAGTVTNSTTSAHVGTYSARLDGANSSVTFNNVDISDYNSVVLSVAFSCYNVDSDDDLYLDISYDNGATWTGTGSVKLVDGFSNANVLFGATNASNPTTVSANPWTVNIGASETQIRIRLRYSGGTSGEYYYIDDIKLSGTPTGPIIALSALNAFGNVCTTTTAGPNSFTITGSNLTTDDVTVSALSGFTYSTTAGGTYTNSLTLSQPGGSFTQDIYVKFNPTLVQSYNGDIIVGGGGATSKNCATVGSGVNTTPSISSPTSASITTTTAVLGGNITALGCTNVTKRGIFWSTTNGFADGVGTEVSETSGAPYSTGAFTVNVSGLSASTVYYFKAFTENSGGRVYTSQGTFTTACTNVSLPYSQGFENAGSMPSCWDDLIVVDSDADAAISFVSSATNPTLGAADEGTYFVKFNSYSCDDGDEIRLISPPITTTGLSDIQVKFAFYHDNGFSTEITEGVTVQWSTDGSVWNNLDFFLRYNTTTGWSNKTVNLPVGAENQSVVYVAFLFHSGYGNNCFIDDLLIETAKPEPTNHPTDFSCGITTSSSIPLTWTDAIGSTLPDGYLIKWNTTGYGDITSPSDGTAESNGAGVINIAYGLETVDINGLLANTTYYFKIFSYTNSGSLIDYKTDGTVLSTSCSTIDGPCIEESFEGTFPPTDWTNSGTIEKTSGGCEGTKHIAFNATGDFIVSASFDYPESLTFEYNRSSNTDAWEMKVQIGNSSTGPWTDVHTISSAETTCQTANVDLSSYTAQTGLYLKFIDTRASGTAERYLDNVTVQCQATPSITLTGSDPSSIDFMAGSTNNTIYRIEVQTGGGLSQDITEIRFRADAIATDLDQLLLNYKLYYSTNNILDLNDVLIDTETTIASDSYQLVTFSGFTQTINVGTPVFFFITVDISNSPVIGEEIQLSSPGVTYTLNGGAVDTENYAVANSHEIIDSPSDIIAVSGSESDFVSSIINTSGPLSNSQGTQVWQFTVRDGGSAGDTDLTPTILTEVILSQNSGNSINDWADAIESCDLFDQNGNHLDNASITANQITFSGFSAAVPDNQQRVFSVRLTIQTNPNNSGENNDLDDFVFNITSANVIADPTGSQFGSFSQINSQNGKNVLDVTATVLEFVQQPSDVGVGAVMLPYVTVRGEDANGNQDNGPLVISITSEGTLDSSPVHASLIDGIATFYLIHTVVQADISLTASATGATSVISNEFDVLDVTTFNPGDLIVIGFDASVNSGSDDAVYLLTLVDIKPGTSFKWVNSRFEAGASVNERTMRWGGSGDEAFDDPSYIDLVWNGAGNIAAGSIISFETTGTTNTLLLNPRINGVSNTNLQSTGYSGGANVSSSAGDQMWLVQGYYTSFGTVGVDRYSLLTGQVLFGLTSRESWVLINDVVSTSTSTRESRIHPDIECFNLALTGTNGYSYYKNGTGGNPGTPLHTGTRREIIMSIQTASNWNSGAGTNVLNINEEWIASTATPSSSSTIGKAFTISTSGNTLGTWIGGASGEVSDWFKCGNWEGLTVPDLTTDVTIPNVTNAPVIDCSPSNADAQKFDFVAECSSLTINLNASLMVDDNIDTLKVYGDILINGILDANGTTGGQIFTTGNWTNNGTFDEGFSNVTFNGTTQSIETSGTSETFYNVNFMNGTTTLNDDIFANNLTMANSGVLNSNSNDISLSGNWTNHSESGFTESNSTVTFSGSNTQTITTSGGEIFNNLTINKSSEVLVTNNNLTINGDIDFTDDVLDYRDYTLTLNGNLIRTSGTMTVNSASSLIIGGTGALGGLYFTSGAATLSNLQLNRVSSGSAGLTNNLSINNNLTLDNGNLLINDNHLILNGQLFTSAGYLAGTVLSELSIAGSGVLNGVVQFSTGNDNLQNLTVSRNSGEITLGSNVNIYGISNMIDGELFTLNYTVDLGSVGTLIETPINPSGYITGNVKATRNIGSGSQTFGGIGLNITDNSGVNSTIVTRVTGTKLQGNLNCCASNWSIARYFDIVPANNSGLNASLEFSYFEHELDGVSETDLMFFKATLPFGGDNPWIDLVGTGNTSSNIVSINNLTGFSRWTVAPKLNPLPVELISFSANCNTNAVELIWSTASEINNDYFEVQKSDDGKLWHYIGTVKGAGNASSINNYSFNVKENTANAYYRLRQVDFDGKFEYSPVVFSNCTQTQDVNLIVYPNPVTDYLNVMVENWKSEKIYWEIVNTTGQIVLKGTFKPVDSYFVEQINMSDLKPGIYVVRFMDDDNLIIRKAEKK